MTRVHRLAIAVLACAMLQLVARADDASKRAKVRQILTLAQMPARVEQSRLAADKQTHKLADQLTAGMPMSARDKRLVVDFYVRFTSLLNHTYSWEALEPEYERVYFESYTEQELDALLAFAKTPAGSSYMAKSADVSAKLGAVSGKAYSDLMPQIQQMLDDLMRHMSSPDPAQTGQAAEKAS